MTKPKVTWETPCRCTHKLEQHDTTNTGMCFVCDCKSFKRADVAPRRLFGLLPGKSGS